VGVLVEQEKNVFREAGFTYGQLVEGATYQFPGLTVTSAHVVEFGGLCGDLNPLHMDEEWCRKNSIFRTRVAHGTLTLALVMGPLGPLLQGTALAMLGISFKCPNPVKLGDSVYPSAKVAVKADSKKHPGGRVTFELCGRNQHGDEVFVGEATILVADSVMSAS
jgi:3-hydroxybutyryl-CoA dehydratase